MQANELRIGNWVSFKGLWEGEVEKITPVSLTIKSNSGFFDIESFEGIELNEVSFERIGFTHFDLGIVQTKQGYWMGDFSIELKDGKYIYNHHLEVTTIHQLQNLYFCLCGEELIYKP